MDITVRPGDSLWYYSQLFRVPLQLIIDSNRDVNLQVLSVGQRIRIPGYVAFEVQIIQGDTLWSIAQRRNVPLEAIYLANPTLNPNRLQVGQTIRVPLRITWRLVERRADV